MDLSQTYNRENLANSTITVCTTGISALEKSCINLPQNIVLSSSLTPKTQILVTYKCVFTEKYIQALAWNIPIISSNYLYNTQNSYLEYQMKPFEGAKFSTSGMSSESYSNYFILQGAVYEQNCSIFIDFLITNNETSEKYRFCKKYNIPVIFDSEVYTMDYTRLIRGSKQDAKELNCASVFKGRTFYIDGNMPKQLFNRLRRAIIDNDGVRVSVITEATDYILSLDYSKYEAYSDRLYYYQYVFDCVEYRAVLYPEFYRYCKTHRNGNVLEGVAAVIDPGVGRDARKYASIVKSMGGAVRGRIDMKTTHLLVDRKRFCKLPECKSGSVNKGCLSSTQPLVQQSSKYQQYQIVSVEWIDQCLVTLEYVKERKYLIRENTLKLARIEQVSREMKFQFTGLPEYFKSMAIEKFEKYGIKYSDASRYEDATHIIMGNMNTTEKFLYGLVSGSWMLTPEFVEKFENQDDFDFSRYEWTADEEMSEKDRRIIRSARKWRQRIKDGGTRPFHNWVVKILCSKEKEEHYRRLIEYGGGRMTVNNDYTHYFRDSKMHKSSGDCDDKELKTQVSPDYIFSYLFK